MPTAPPIQAVVFDLDDTLYPERDYFHSGYRAVAAHLQRCRPGTPEVDEWMWQRFCRGDSDRMFDALSAQFGLGLSPAQIAELVEVYRTHRPAIQPLPEAVELLQQLRGLVKLGLLSDGFLPAQQYKLDALGLEGLFDVVVFTESLGRDCWKPSPAAFLHIAQRLGVPHAGCVYVADNPAKDFLPPNSLGWRTIQWRRADQVHAGRSAPVGGRPQRVVETLSQLQAALGA